MYGASDACCIGLGMAYNMHTVHEHLLGLSGACRVQLIKVSLWPYVAMLSSPNVTQSTQSKSGLNHPESHLPWRGPESNQEALLHKNGKG